MFSRRRPYLGHHQTSTDTTKKAPPMQSFILRHKPQITIISGTLIAAGRSRFALYRSRPTPRRSSSHRLSACCRSSSRRCRRCASGSYHDVLVSIAVFGASSSALGRISHCHIPVPRRRQISDTLNQTRRQSTPSPIWRPSAAVRRADGTFETVPVDDACRRHCGLRPVIAFRRWNRDVGHWARQRVRYYRRTYPG